MLSDSRKLEIQCEIIHSIDTSVQQCGVSPQTIRADALLDVDSYLYDPDDEEIVPELTSDSNLNEENPDLVALYLGVEPAHIQYTALMVRFDSVLASMNISEQIEESRNKAIQISSAGFFFDNGVLKCYSCGASISEMLDDQQLWQSHAPMCAHVLRSRGTCFVRDAMLVARRSIEMGIRNQQFPTDRIVSEFVDSTIFKKYFAGVHELLPFSKMIKMVSTSTYNGKNFVVEKHNTLFKIK